MSFIDKENIAHLQNIIPEMTKPAQQRESIFKMPSLPTNSHKKLQSAKKKILDAITPRKVGRFAKDLWLIKNMNRVTLKPLSQSNNCEDNGEKKINVLKENDNKMLKEIIKEHKEETEKECIKETAQQVNFGYKNFLFFFCMMFTVFLLSYYSIQSFYQKESHIDSLARQIYLSLKHQLQNKIQISIVDLQQSIWNNYNTNMYAELYGKVQQLVDKENELYIQTEDSFGIFKLY